MKKQKPYNVVSLFDGCSIARLALDEAKIPVGKYYASEIDPYAIAITQKNFPDTIQIGSVLNVAGDKKSTKQQYLFSHTKTAIRSYYTGGIDLLIGGSPCQDLSIAKKDRKGLDGERSGLFWEYVRIWNELKPRYFILENVASMPREAKDLISETLGVQPVMIDAALVSAQRRKRLFWVGKLNGEKYEQVHIPQPEDRHIYLKDILQPENEVDEKYYIKDETLHTILEKMRQGKPLPQSSRIHQTDGKAVTISALGGGAGAKTGLYVIKPNGDEQLKSNTLRTSGRGSKFGDKHNWDQILVVPEATKQGFAVAKDGDAIDLSFPTSTTRRGRVGNKAKNLMTSSTISVFTQGRVRKLTPIECERLQSLPDGHTEGVSDSQRYKACGNAFNADVVAHILRHIPKE